ncbi:D-2-hydroxyacid dehydrogenase family protein [Emydomyces testavorans]|uniref:D-2-hydroxyacid dehydrogenase family protein n=1 Tax=Emydomyces testavorans TaxID=2070801 RepID=A0AAF0DL12_9EURO|nr:D-2-hydroxyacid dehydrogenase family protein [Emydomyces testavorans]
MASAASPQIRLAILDDYQGIAPHHFAQFTSRLQITSYDNTLNPFDPSQHAALLERLQPYQIISTMRERTPFPRELIAQLPNLKLLLTTGSTNRAIDLLACAEHGITVTGTTGGGRQQDLSGLVPPTPMVQHTWALILGLAHNIAKEDASVKAGGWQESLTTSLSGKTLALLGLGWLGAETAKIGVLAFNMKIIAWSMNLTQHEADAQAARMGLPVGTFRVVQSKEELFRGADVLSVHYVLSSRSKGIVGRKELEVMKPTAFFVNTSRGPLVDEDGLLDTLKEGKIKAAALDVFDIEPLPLDSEWRTTQWGKDGRSDVLLSPHMGYVEEGVMSRWYEEQAENVKRWLDGRELMTRL